MTVKDILGKLQDVGERNYWLVRTNGGEYYNSFLSGKFIAIAYDKISLEDISVAHNKKDLAVSILSDKILKEYGENEKRPRHSARQILKFTYGIKKGDIVLLPSENSEEIAFVEVLETPVYNEFDGKFDCPYIKRKKIKLLRIVPRHRLDPHLYKLMFSHHTITEAKQYDTYIDKILNALFIKNEEAHIVLEVQTTDDVKARSLFQLGDLTLDLFDDFCKEEDLDYNSDDFDIKLAVQSPGFIELVGSPAGIVIIGIILVAIAGGGFDFNVKNQVTANLKTDGIIEKVRKFLKTKSNISTRKDLIQKNMQNLDVKDPKELIEIIKELNKE